MKTFLLIAMLSVLTGCASGNYDYCSNEELNCNFTPKAQGAATRAVKTADGKIKFVGEYSSYKSFMQNEANKLIQTPNKAK